MRDATSASSGTEVTSEPSAASSSANQRTRPNTEALQRLIGEEKDERVTKEVHETARKQERKAS